MTTPPTAHQLVSGELFRQLTNFLEGKKCRVIAAPFSVRLFERAGVREYWIADLDTQSVLVLLPDSSGAFHIQEDYGREDVAKVHVLDGCFIELGKVFS